MAQEEKKIRAEKLAIAGAVRDALENSLFLLMVDYSGLSVQQMQDLRGELRQVESTLMVTKNAFLGRAADSLGWDGIRAGLQGATAMITGTGEVTPVAKRVTDFAKQNQRPSIKGGWLGQQLLSAGDVKDMAMIPPREIMLSLTVGTIAAPMTQFVGVLNQKLLTLLYVLKAVEEKKSA